ncbi:oligosaccharyl transferase stt3 subunit [Phytophthora boehmeriae]|uniref:dolichyl-diphosphooligosaccharide--protein glycotransferase n=1 Tax=Phytophthora boehmeriae TaxID=109152 RepID=A0A8T1WSD4_9STRA|nr:oligosaccharyl transferase stt3 subunit [Phytophthora boehmeriae]
MQTLTTWALLALICVLSFAIRLFPVVIWGSVIHEFDPQFNFRVTKFLAQNGAYELLDWFDDRAWYPLGRIVGTTVYPGLMAAATAIQWILEQVLRMPISVRDACVFLAPLFAALACIAQFLLTKEATGNTPTALLSATLLSVSPAYISRSTAGSFDNEGVAIFLLIFTFFLWVRAVRTGAMLWAALAAVSYFGMALSWGGYVFIINIIPIHVLVSLLSGNYSARLYVAYSTFYPLATFGAMQVPFIGFNAVLKGESAGSHGVFALLQAYAFLQWLSTQIPKADFARLLRACLSAGVAFMLLVIHSRHSTNIAKKVYSSTSLVFEKMNATTKHKELHDDYREAFAWLRQNTPGDAKILSWWDYGYQITTLANRTVLVDNNTWNNTHIATVGRVMTSREEDALPILRSLDVDYVFVLFGGKVGMPGDDLDKLPWIVKISEGVFPDAVIESEFQVNGRYIFHENATLAMTESVMYKLSYFEFNNVESFSSQEGEKPVLGWDMNRRFKVPARDIELRHFEHMFTSDAWMVRIYRVKHW